METEAKRNRMSPITFTPIGIIHSPWTDLAGMPIQPAGARGVRGHIDILDEYAAGLSDLDGFSHLILLYHFHRAGGCRLRVVPFLDTVERGLFATRAPRRPNPIGLSVVALAGISGCRIDIAHVDILDGTPLLDIKPYVPEFDAEETVRVGWIEKARGGAAKTRSDERFAG